MKKVIVILALLLSVSLSARALGPSLGLQLEVRAGGYMTVSPDEAKNMFGNGFLIGGSLRKAVFPMVKVGLSIDRISLNDNQAVQFADLSAQLQDELIVVSDDLDIEFTTTPVCLEIMLDPPILPLYAHAGYGLYKSKVTVKDEGSGTLLYDESKSRWWGFLGAGVKMGLPMLPLSFRVGAKYHMLRVDDSAMNDGIKAISVDAGVRLNI